MANPRKTVNIVLVHTGTPAPQHAAASQQLADALSTTEAAVSPSQIHLTDESEIKTIIESLQLSSRHSTSEQTQSTIGDSEPGKASNALLVVCRPATNDVPLVIDQRLQAEMVTAAKSADIPCLAVLIGDPEFSTASAGGAIYDNHTTTKDGTAKAKYRTFTVRDVYRQHDIALITRQCFSMLNIELAEDSALASYPVAPPKPGGTIAIDQQTLTHTIARVIPDWELHTQIDNSANSQSTTEISRSFRFGSFQSAIRYMHQVAPACDVANHHPRWENNWRTVSIWLTTWDADQQITDRDLQLARYFNHVYTEYGYAQT